MKDDRVYLLHIRDAIQQIQSYTKDGEEVFYKTPMVRDATVRNLEIIGEAVKNISDQLRNEFHEIPWKSIAGMRDKIIHEYFGVNFVLVWDVVVNELPKLIENVDKILQQFEKSKGKEKKV